MWLELTPDAGMVEEMLLLNGEFAVGITTDKHERKKKSMQTNLSLHGSG